MRRTLSSIVRCMILASLVCVLAAPAGGAPTIQIGDTVEVVHVSTNPGMWANVTLPTFSGSVVIGTQNIKVDGVRMQAFCIDYREMSSTLPNLYTVAEMADAPLPGPAMGEADAMDVMKVWSWWKDSGQTAMDAAVAQVVVWEILDDGNFLTGDFKLNTVGLRTQAQGLLDALPTLTEYTPMLALTSRGYQDYGIPFVPAPGAVLLGSFGLAVLGWSRRHRML